MKNLSIEKREYRDGIKRKETRQGWMDGWMDGCCHGDNLLINRHKPYLLTLGAHAQGYGTCPVCLFVCLSVCLSVCLLPLNLRHRSFLRSN